MRMIAVIVAGAVGLGVCMAASFVTAYHEPTPHDIPVGVVAPAPVVERLQASLDAQAPGAFELERVAGEQAARSAIAERDIDGAFLPHQTMSRLLTASAVSKGNAQAVTLAFTGVAKATGQRLQTTDVAPLPAGDSEGLSTFFLVNSILLPSLLVGAFLSLAAPSMPTRVQVGTLAGFAVLLAGLTVGLTDWVIGALEGEYLALAMIAALFSFAISLTTAALARLHALAGTALAVLIFAVIDSTASGGPPGLNRFMPDLFRWLEPGLPLSATRQAIGNTLYFDGNATAGRLAVVAAWMVGGLAILILVKRLTTGPQHTPESAAREPTVQLHGGEVYLS